MADTLVKRVIVQLKSDDQGVQEKLDEIAAKAEELARLNPEITPKIASAAVNAQMAVLRAELKAAAKEDEPVITPKADTDPAKARIDELKLKLDILKAQRNDIKVGLDASRAELEIATLEAEIDGLGKGAGGGGAGGLAAPWQAWAAAIAAVGAALPVIPAALAAVTAGAGTLALAFGPVLKALSDASAASQATGQSSAQLALTEFSNAQAIASASKAISDAKAQQARDVITSNQQVASAEQSLADAQRTAANDAITSAEQVANAERSLASAQQSEQMAQENLTQAREQAKLTLEQLNNAQADGALQASRAALNLQDAQLNQQQTDASATSTALQKAEAAQSVAEAQQALTEAQQNAANSTDAANKANQEGVNGLPAVVSAQRAYQQSVQGVADAQQSLADAQRQQAQQAQKDAEAVQKAQQAVADAVSSAAYQQQQDAERVAGAVQNLNDTYKQQALQAAATAASSSQASGQFQKDMGGMSSAGQQVVNMLLQVKAGLKPLEDTAQAAVMPGFLTFLQGAQSLLPTVNGEVGAMGSILGGMFTAIGNALKDPQVRKDIGEIFQAGNQMLQILGPAVGEVVKAFIAMGAQSGPAASGFAQGVGAVLRGVGQVFKQLTDPATMKAIGEFWSGVGTIIGALGGPLGTVIGIIAQVLGPVLQAVAPLAVEAFGPKGLGGMLQQVMPALQPLVGALVQLFNQVIAPNLPQMMQLTGQFVQLGLAVAPLVTALVILTTQVLQPLMPLISQTLGSLSLGIGLVTRFATDAVNAISGILSNIPGFFTGMYEFFSNFGGQLYNDALTIGKSIIIGIWNGIWSMLGDFGNFLGSVGTFIVQHKGPPEKDRQLLVPAGQAIMQGLTDSISSQLPQLGSTMHRVTSAITAGAPSAAAGAAGGTQVIRLELAGTDPIWRAIKKQIRVTGGNVQIVGA